MLRLIILSALLLSSSNLDPAAHRDDVEAWYQGRIDRLLKDDGYLTLVGLFRLVEGENRFGSDPDNDLVLGSNAPGHVGTFTVDENGVRVTSAPGVSLTVDGGPVPAGPLVTTPGEETVLELGSLRLMAIERPGLMMLRVRDYDAPLRREFKGVERYEIDPTWRVTARLVPYETPKVLTFANVLGTSEAMEIPAALEFERAGVTYRLDPRPSGDRYWLIFGDATNGVETYGAGRYVYTDDASEDGTVVIDFNKSYNPPCVFTDYSTCPLPPKDNIFSQPVRVGEKSWGEY